MKKAFLTSFLMLALTLTLTIFISFSAFSQVDQETLTITTYYPSPYGVYRNLEVLGGQLIVDSDVVPQVIIQAPTEQTRIEVRSPNGDAGIDVQSDGGVPYVDLGHSGINYDVRLEANPGSPATLRVRGAILRAQTADPDDAYFRIYKDQVVPGS